MSRTHRILVSAALLMVLVLATGCGRKDKKRVLFYAAASLTDVAQELAVTWAEKESGEVVPVLASSSTLAHQIEEGAEAELFLSASQEWMDYLVRETDRVRSESRLDLLSNRLVLVVPPGNPADIETAANLGGKRLESLALGDPVHVPAGIYAAAWLKNAGLWDEVDDKLRPAPDVRAALAWVERGEVDAGIVYFTDARVGDVEVSALLDPALSPPIRYPLALITAKKNAAVSEPARAFYHWLLGDEAAAIFIKHGFEFMAGKR